MKGCLTAEAAEKQSNIHQESISVWQSELEYPKGSQSRPFRRHSCGGRNPGLVGATGGRPQRASATRPYEGSAQLSSHPFANLAIAVADEVKIIEITESVLSPIKNYWAEFKFFL